MKCLSLIALALAGCASVPSKVQSQEQAIVVVVFKYQLGQVSEMGLDRVERIYVSRKVGVDPAEEVLDCLVADYPRIEPASSMVVGEPKVGAIPVQEPVRFWVAKIKWKSQKMVECYSGWRQAARVGAYSLVQVELIQGEWRVTKESGGVSL